MKRTLGALLCLLSACDPSVVDVAEPRSLAPYPNPFGPADPRFVSQPRREKPQEVLVHPDGRRAYLPLPGEPDDPGRHVVVVDVGAAVVQQRIEVGAGPTGLALHPGGRWLVVLNRYSNYASVIDTERDEVAHRPPMELYAVEAAFAPGGERLYVTNRWRDAVVVYDVEERPGGLALRERAQIPVGQNPRDIAVSPDGRYVVSAGFTELTVSIIDATSLREVRRVDLRAPPNGLAFVRASVLVVATLSASSHHRPLEGPDTDGDGHAGDGTPNVNFQDLQNELAVVDVESGAVLHRYTSDTICCRDYRDVDPSDAAREGQLLPPEEDWIVGGALPEQLTVDGDGLLVTYSASNQVQRFAVVDDSGALAPGPVFETRGHSPHGLAVAGERLLVVHRLSETLGIYDKESGALAINLVVGDVSGGAFPATDAEIGELVNDVTATFTVDGDQACVMCHRENGNIDKSFSMPLAKYAGLGDRMTMSYRGGADTRPWFFESMMDETNLKAVINEFARIENFCCSDYIMWPSGAPTGCSTSPPPECQTAPNASSLDGFNVTRLEPGHALEKPRPTPHPSRDRFYLDAAADLLGRTTSFGDGLYFEDPISGEREPIALDFDGVTRSLGLFLMQKPRLLPNPFDPESPAAKRGRAIFNDAAVGCAACHPAPTFAVSTDNNPFDLPLRMGPVVTPNRKPDGTNLDLLSIGFLDAFPLAEMESCEDVCGDELCSELPNACDDIRDVRFGVPHLRGIWDRAPSMLHNGQARGLREVLSTPGHPALDDGERGLNERDGIIDTHGGTSHLSRGDVEDLIAYLLTL